MQSHSQLTFFSSSSSLRFHSSSFSASFFLFKSAFSLVVNLRPSNPTSDFRSLVSSSLACTAMTINQNALFTTPHNNNLFHKVLRLGKIWISSALVRDKIAICHQDHAGNDLAANRPVSSGIHAISAGGLGFDS